MSGSSHSQYYPTQSMPVFMSSPAARESPSPASSLSFELSAPCVDAQTLLDRRVSSFSCSTSNSSRRDWRVGRTRFRYRLPFASVSAQQAAANVPDGTSSSTPSQQPDAHSTSQNSGSPLDKLRQLSPQQIRSAIESVTAKDTFKAGDLLGNGRYKLLDKLGLSSEFGIAEGLPDGRFTTLWDATDTATGKQVVIKCVEGGDATSYLAGSREAALHAQAGRHHNILQLLDAFEHRSKAGRHACMVLEKAGSNLYIVNQLYGGQYRDPEGSAESGLCMTSTPGGRRTLRSFARQTLEALDHLHTRKGLVHMDISSDNILIDKPFQHIREVNERALVGQGWQRVANFGLAVAGALGNKQAMQHLQQQVDTATDDPRIYHEQNLHKATVKLTDFGRAVPYPQQQQLSGVQGSGVLDHNRDGLIVMNDPGLRPPEEVLGMDYVTPAYDIWRTGCLVYELATGTPLFSPAAWAALRQQQPVLRQYSDDMMHLMDMVTVLGQMPTEVRQHDTLSINKPQYWYIQTSTLPPHHLGQYTPLDRPE
eukprot:GHUV01025376.1.p1 GENE.GHUV01025376.1~~GHUV01025376.1.p1  ORF type:complete len:537 (+),score=110.24 GHUV01025376.1:176-1786(+)